MRAFLYALSLQLRLDIRSKTMLAACYIVPLAFFSLMGGIFTAVMPGFQENLISSMTVFGVTMGALIGLPPSLVEIYGGQIKNVYKANGVPQGIGIVLTNISAFLHLMAMSLIIFLASGPLFGAVLPDHLLRFFLSLALFTLTTLAVATVIGMALRDQAKTSMWSIIVFLPSIMLSGIMFPAQMLPAPLETAGMAFPALWGYRILSNDGPVLLNALPLAAAFLVCLVISLLLLRRSER